MLLASPSHTTARPALPWILGILLALVPLASLEALDPARSPDQYVRESWSRHEGLPQSSVTAILQDADGYLWLGTFGGLARHRVLLP